MSEYRRGRDLAKLYKPDHQVGMEVPEGGSNCDKCGHLAGWQKCDDDEFIEWNGSDRIPIKTSRYCCDMFQIRGKNDEQRDSE